MMQRVKNRIAGLIDRLMMKWEDKRKGSEQEEFTFCHKCRYTHEYRLNENKVFLRCKACRHVHLKRDMTGKEHADILNYRLQETNAPKTEPARMGATNMVNDGKKFLSLKERKAYIAYCENMTQFYRADKHVQFHLLDDFELMDHVENYRYDEATPSPLDEICDGKG